MSRSPDFRIAPRQGLLAAIPAEAKALIISKIHERAAAGEVTRDLTALGIVRSSRTVMTWMREIRIWLGLPNYYPSSRSARQAVIISAAVNGSPSAADILTGWTPATPLPSPAIFETLPQSKGVSP